MRTDSRTRPRCSVFIAVSADGYIARRDGSIDWLASVQGPDDYGYATFFHSVDVLIVGRNTYDTALGFDSWPYAGKRCIVLTNRPAVAHHGEEFFAGGVDALVDQLGQERARHCYVDGGSTIRQFLRADLLDTVTLSIVPVLLGDGIRLFEAGGCEQQLALESARSWPTGLTQLRYQMKAA